MKSLILKFFSKKSPRPLIFFEKKVLAALIFFEKSAPPIFFSKSLRPLSMVPARVPDKFWPVPKGVNYRNFGRQAWARYARTILLIA